MRFIVQCDSVVFLDSRIPGYLSIQSCNPCFGEAFSFRTVTLTGILIAYQFAYKTDFCPAVEKALQSDGAWDDQRNRYSHGLMVRSIYVREIRGSRSWNLGFFLDLEYHLLFMFYIWDQSFNKHTKIISPQRLKCALKREPTLRLFQLSCLFLSTPPPLVSPLCRILVQGLWPTNI